MIKLNSNGSQVGGKFDRIEVRGKNVTIKDVTVEGEGITLYSNYNCSGLTVEDSTFISHSNNAVKIIADNVGGIVENVVFRNCKFVGGRMAVEIQNHKNTDYKVNGVRFEGCEFVDLKYDGNSLGAQSASDSSSIALKLSSWTGTSCDIWTLDTITNDFKRNIPLGTLDDYNAEEPSALTYYGALRIYRNKVVELSGSSAIVVVSNATHRNNGGYTSTSTNSAGCKLSDYSNALMCIAEIEGWYFVDVFNYGGITDDNLSYTTIDGLHPNNLGYKLSVKPWIEQLNIIKAMYD